MRGKPGKDKGMTQIHRISPNPIPKEAEALRNFMGTDKVWIQPPDFPCCHTWLDVSPLPLKHSYLDARSTVSNSLYILSFSQCPQQKQNTGPKTPFPNVSHCPPVSFPRASVFTLQSSTFLAPSYSWLFRPTLTPELEITLVWPTWRGAHMMI